MFDKELLDVLACPETKKDLELADQGVIDRLNGLIKEGKLKNRLQNPIAEQLDGGLLRVGDKSCLYPIRAGIPVLLIEEQIVIN